MYEPHTFDIPQLTGISQNNIDEHMKLYQGYVKNTNMILEKLSDASIDPYQASELQRRLSFEYNGMKNHEYYFGSLSGGHQDPNPQSALYTKIEADFGSFDACIDRLKTVAKTRGVGWAILGYDHDADRLITYWVDEQHLGHLNSVQYIIGIDMWEHAFVADYQPSGKGQYIDDYFANVNWSVVEDIFANT